MSPSITIIRLPTIPTAIGEVATHRSTTASVRTRPSLPLPGGMLKASAASIRVACNSVPPMAPFVSWQITSTTSFTAQAAPATAMKPSQARFDRMSKERILLAALSVLTLVITGCGNGLASVTGAVTLDGQAITGPNKYGTVSFYRESGGGAPAIGIMDQTGHYTLKTGSADGIEPGTYRVAIAVKKVTPATQ